MYLIADLQTFQISLRKRLQSLRDYFILKPSLGSVVTVALIALVIGFMVTSSGTHFWDDTTRYRHSVNLVHTYGLLGGNVVWFSEYAALWEFFLGLQTEFLFYTLTSPYWVRHALNVCLYLTGLYTLYVLLWKVGYRRATAALAVAMLFGLIRLGGHALFNPKDMPAAMIFLLVSLGLWLLVRDLLEHRQKTTTLILLGVVSMMPFVVRVPLLLHAVLVAGFLILWALIGRHRSLLQRVRLIAIPLLSAVIVFAALNPRVWYWGADDVVTQAVEFANVPWQSTVYLFNTSLTTTELPWWYALPWVVVQTQPLVLIVMLAGLILLCLSRRDRPHLRVPTTFGVIKLNVEQWIALVILLAWVAIMVVRPTLYDEDRHILFLYPLLMLLGALGLSRLADFWQRWLAGLCVVASLWSYGQWGIYSYAYASPLRKLVSYRTNIGDYNGLCMNKGVQVLPQYLEPETLIYAYPIQLASLQDLHLRYRLLFPQTDFPHYVFVQDHPKERPYAVLMAHRGQEHQQAKPPLQGEVGQVLWTDSLPTGEVTCSLAWYP